MTANNGFLTLRDGSKLYFEDVGEGTPIVFSPGFICTTKFFQRNVEELSQQYRVITYDPRNFGRSSCSLKGNTVKEYAADLRELIQHLKLQDVILVGWSLSGSVVVQYAAMYNNANLKALCIHDAALYPFCSEYWNPYVYKGFNVDRWKADHSIWYTQPNTFVNNFAGRVFKGTLPDEERAWIVEEMSKAFPWGGMELHLDWCHTDSVTPLKELLIPVIIFSSDTYGYAYGEKYASEIRTYCELHKFDRGGHMLHYYESEDFDRILVEFIEKI